MSAVVAFLTDDGVDGAGRTFAQVLVFGDEDLERRHDFIQWLFPLAEPSAAVPGSPVLTSEDIAILRASKVAQGRQERAAERMLRFYADTSGWRGPVDHNHLRITRIIKSLRLLCGNDAADGFRAHILALAETTTVSPLSRDHWNAA
jgi:hypothetical protein